MNKETLPTIMHLGPFHEDKTPMASLDSRINKAIELYKAGLSKPIIFSAGATYQGITKPDGWEEMIKLIPKTKFNSVEYVKKILIQKGVKSEDIITNNLGLDTVGEIYFLTESVIKPIKFKKFRVITSQFHMKRCLQIYKKILGPKYKIIPESAFCEMDTNSTLKEKVSIRELESLTLFKKTFKNIKSGDAASFEEKLYSNHKRYSVLPEKEKIRFHKKD
ncbi:MAG: YdcF family protein [Candidatus Nanoarchaeia archaeon]